MKVAVSGATGFIGRHVLAALASTGAEVTAVVRPGSPHGSSLPAARIAEIDIRADGTDAFERVGSPNVFIHLAWGGLPNYRSIHHFADELPAHYRFVEGLVKSGLRTLVVAGTCLEYGMQSGPLAETLEPRPANPYGYAKDALRRQLEYLKDSHPFVLVWPRLFYLFGDGQAESSLYPQLRKAVAEGATGFDMSGGEQLRDYLPATEAARRLVMLALMQQDVGVVNLCSGQPISVRGLVEQWIRANGWSIALNLGRYPYPDYEPMAFWGDRRKLAALLGES